jgi:hypothetical protein
MVAGERGLIVLALVAEELPELVKTTAVRDEQRPIEVPAFVAQVAEQRPIALVELLALTLALDGVGFLYGNRNDAVEVAARPMPRDCQARRDSGLCG